MAGSAVSGYLNSCPRGAGGAGISALPVTHLRCQGQSTEPAGMPRVRGCPAPARGAARAQLPHTGRAVCLTLATGSFLFTSVFKGFQMDRGPLQSS